MNFARLLSMWLYLGVIRSHTSKQKSSIKSCVQYDKKRLVCVQLNRLKYITGSTKFELFAQSRHLWPCCIEFLWLKSHCPPSSLQYTANCAGGAAKKSLATQQLLANAVCVSYEMVFMPCLRVPCYFNHKTLQNCCASDCCNPSFPMLKGGKELCTPWPISPCTPTFLHQDAWKCSRSPGMISKKWSPKFSCNSNIESFLTKIQCLMRSCWRQLFGRDANAKCRLRSWLSNKSHCWFI